MKEDMLPQTNWALKEAVLDRFRTQMRAAASMGVRAQRLSYLIHRHISPSRRDIEALEKALGKKRVKELLGGNNDA